MGVAHLNTIRPKPLSVHGSPGHINPETRRLEPLSAVPANGPRAGLTGGSGTKSNPYTLYLVPGDAATIYDTPNAYNAAFSSGTSYTGAGVKIGVGGDATISASIVQTYRSLFLGNSTAPTINYCISTSSSPGYSCSSSSSGTKIGTTDSDEAYIDTELSGGIAPGASIYYYASEDLNTGIEAAIDTNVVDIFSLSFGECESQLGSSNNSLINGWWSQAAGQGIAVTVSTGDSGSAGCDDDNTQESAKDGLAVSGFASTPYNIAVGGTDFYPLVSSYSTYASTSLGTAGAPTYYRTAKSYIPESTWNDSPYINTTISANEPWSANGYPTSDNNIIAGGGGASGVYSKPTTWQVATGVPSDGKRDLPDVSLMAGNEFDDAIWVVCDDETYNLAFSTTEKGVLNCSNISGGYFDAYGGTSTSAPTFAGILALVEQKTGGRLGLPANELYSLYGTAPSAFHDVIVGNNSVYCKNPSANCVEDSAGYYFESGYDTTTGYDQATGLGSVDATKLVNAWSSTTGSAKAAVTVDVTTTPPVTIADPVDVTVTVASSPSGGTTPTGTVTLTSGSYTSAATALTGTGSYSITIPANSLASEPSPGELDRLTVTYSGNSIYATATNSATVTVTSMTVQTPTVTVTPASGSIDSSQSLNVTVSVAGVTGYPTPTGTVTLTSGSYNSGVVTLSSSGSCTAASCIITIPANSLNSILGGSIDTLTATYSGDGNYTSGVGTASVTVTKSIFALQATNIASLAPGATTGNTSTVTVSSATFYTGTITLSCVLTSPTNLTDPPTCSGGSSTVTLNFGTPTPPGTATVTVSTTAASSELVWPKLPGKGRGLFGAGGGAVLAFLVFLGIPARRRSWRSMLGVLVVMAALGSLAGCGGSSHSSTPGTTAGTYTFTVTGTGNDPASTTETTTFTVNVN
jgi:hypothetical protein